MSQSDITAPILSYDDINKRAEDFLREHKRNEILPVDIEAIAEFDLGLNIFPFPNLQKTFDVEGFISGDLDVIYVDEFIYYQRPARYRFTLTHEIGHNNRREEILVAKDTPGMRGYRSRNEDGELRQKRGDTHVGTIEKKYGRDFDVRSDTHLSTLLEREGVASLNDSTATNDPYSIVDMGLFLNPPFPQSARQSVLE